jgi:Na+/H+ antiporter NhaD/arsenite permease-like protein
VDPRGVVIFAITYVLISARRLGWLGFDRPAGALAGAVACVVVGVLTPRAAVDAVDTDTLLLLFGMMGLGAFLAIDGFFDHVAIVAIRVAGTPGRLLGMVVWGAGILSALITNDAVCVLGAPLVVGIVQRHRLPALPFLLALATGANTGSVATLVGNPQNMLCASLGGLAYRDHLLLVGPVAVVALLINHRWCAGRFGGYWPQRRSPTPPHRRCRRRRRRRPRLVQPSGPASPWSSSPAPPWPPSWAPTWPGQR